MSENKNFEQEIAELARESGRYRPEAYSFVVEALQFAVERVGQRRHLTAAELTAGLLKYAEQQYGALAETVLADWGVRSASDVGNLVYQMIDAALLSASPQDHKEDFDRIKLWFAPQPEPELETHTRSLPKID